MVDRVKGGREGVHPCTPHPHQAEFTIMMEYAPESGNCQSTVFVLSRLWLSQCIEQALLHSLSFLGLHSL